MNPFETEAYTVDKRTFLPTLNMWTCGPDEDVNSFEGLYLRCQLFLAQVLSSS